MKNIKHNTNVSDFDGFLCKLEEKEELCCFGHCNVCDPLCGQVCSARCGQVFHAEISDVDMVDEKSDNEPEPLVDEHDTKHDQNDKHESPSNRRNTEHEQDDKHKSPVDEDDMKQVGHKAIDVSK